MYFQGVVIPVGIGNKQAYLDMAKRAAPIFADHCALGTVGCWGDNGMAGKSTDFTPSGRTMTGRSSCPGSDGPARQDATQGRRRDGCADARSAHARNPPGWNGQLAIFGGFTPILDTAHP